jgi:diketogulonate reductase-like aldo/keto reductase
MEPLVRAGLTRHIGVSNFSIEMLERMQLSPRVTIQPYAIQIEHSVYNQQRAMLQYLHTREIRLMSWAPLARGRAGPFGATIFEEPSSNRSRKRSEGRPRRSQ